MISPKLRCIREHNRTYKAWMRLLWAFEGHDAPLVLMVHGFKGINEIRNAFTLSRDSFVKLLDYLEQEGWSPLSYNELKDCIVSRKKCHKCYYVTFDDAFETVYTQAFPILVNKNIEFTTFLTRDLIGRPDFLNEKQIQEMCKYPKYHIGGHGDKHEMFRYYSKERMLEECNGEKKWLEDTFHTTVDSFAFPYGRVVEVSSNNRRIIKSTDYSLAFSAIEGTFNSVWFTGKYFIPRVNVSETFVKKFTSGKKLKFKDCEGR